MRGAAEMRTAPLAREVGQSFYLMFLVAALVGGPLGVGLAVVRAFA
jgi:hypothetical protein